MLTRIKAFSISAIPLFLFAFTAHAELDKVISLTIYGNSPNQWQSPYWYNQGETGGFAIINFDKVHEFTEGLNEIVVENLPQSVEVSSVKLGALSGTKIIAEQNFEKSSLSLDDLFTRSIGKDIEVEQQAGERTIYFRGKLLQGSPQLFIEDEKRVRFVNQYSSIIFPTESGIVAGNSIKWVIASKDEGEETVSYNYKTAGITWSASYDVYYDDTTETARLEGWAEVNNSTNIDINDSAVKLVAGQVNQVSTPRVAMMKAAAAPEMAMDSAVASGGGYGNSFQNQEFSDYQMYTIDRKIDLKPYSFKKIKLFADKLQVKPERQYVYEGWEGKKNAGIELKFKNSEENGLGIPLPGGRFSVYSKAQDGEFELAGQDTSEHTAKDAETKLKIGKAFDITAERTQLDQSSDQNRRVGRYKIRMEFSNAKDKEVKVLAKEMINAGGKWQVTNSTIPYDKHSANEIWFDVVIPANGQNTVEYTAEYYW